jgi:hypothetical protein
MELPQGRHRLHLITVTLLAMACAVSLSPLVTAKKMEPPPDATPENLFVSETVSSADAGVFSHRKLLQTAVAKTGAPVYRFVECRHLSKEESKLVQVGLSSDGGPMYRVTRGDYCLFTTLTGTPDVNTLNVRPLSIRRSVSNSLPHNTTAVLNSDALNQGLSSTQQYVCERFGPACRVALAVQLAENPSGACEIYHYNTSDGTLDWGYFQINSVHLKNPGLNLKDLLDCKANIDYAYRLFLQKGFAPWAAYTNGAYRKFLPSPENQRALATVAQELTLFRAVVPE